MSGQGCCVPMFSSFKKTDCFNKLDANKDGKLDLVDIETGVKHLAENSNFDAEVAKDMFGKFVSKVNKLESFLTAAQILFTEDKETSATIANALQIIKLFTIATKATTEIGTDAQAVALNINDVGQTINDLQATSASIQAYTDLFAKAGLNIGFNSTQFAKVDEALAKVKAMQLLWSSLTPKAATPTLT